MFSYWVLKTSEFCQSYNMDYNNADEWVLAERLRCFPFNPKVTPGVDSILSSAKEFSRFPCVKISQLSLSQYTVEYSLRVALYGVHQRSRRFYRCDVSLKCESCSIVSRGRRFTQGTPVAHTQKILAAIVFLVWC